MNSKKYLRFCGGGVVFFLEKGLLKCLKINKVRCSVYVIGFQNACITGYSTQLEHHSTCQRNGCTLVCIDTCVH